MGALHLAKQERAGGGDHEVAEDRADQAVGACVVVADELGEGRDERAEDDGQGQRSERALERGHAEDVGDLEHGRREQQRDRRPRRPGPCAPGVERAAEDQHEQREPRQAGDGSVRQDRLQDERPDQQRQQETPPPARDEAEIGVDHRHGRRPPGSFTAPRPLQIATSPLEEVARDLSQVARRTLGRVSSRQGGSECRTSRPWPSPRRASGSTPSPSMRSSPTW